MKDYSWQFPGYGESKPPELQIEYVSASVTDTCFKTIRIRVKSDVFIASISPADFEIMDDTYNSPFSGSTEFRVHQVWREDDIITFNVNGLPYMDGTTYTIRTKNSPDCMVEGKYALVIKTKDIVFFDECVCESSTITRYSPPNIISSRKHPDREYSSITAECYVGLKGLVAERFVICVGDGFSPDKLTARSFTAYDMSGRNKVIGKAKDVSYQNGKLTIELDDFPVTSKFRFVCMQRGFYRLGLGFTYRDITDFKVETADEFGYGQYRLNDKFTLLYRLFEPKETCEPKPLVLCIGAGGIISGENNETQLWDIQPIGFAEEGFQKEHPCYVLVPQLKNPDVYGGWTRNHFDSAKEVIRNLISQGKVDPGRVYFSGVGLGNRLSLLFRDPDFFAAALITTPVWCDYEMLSTLSSLPMCFVTNAGEQMRIVERARFIYQHLKHYGNTKSKYVEYSIDEMEEVGGLYSSRDYHCSHLLAYNDYEHRTWLFEHSR